MKNFLLFNQSFGTVGSPNQTGETLTRENRIGLMSYLRRTLMLLFAVLVMSIANIGMAWGQTLIETDDFETSTALSWGGFVNQDVGTVALYSESRSGGTYSLGTTHNGTTVKYVKTPATISVAKDSYLHVIAWAKMPTGDGTSEGTGTQAYTSVNVGGNTDGTAVNMSASSWKPITVARKAGSATSTAYAMLKRKHSAKGTILFDDVVIYVSTNSTTDVVAPLSATSASATTSSISWTNGSDANTGRQNTLIWKRNSGNTHDLSLNNQGVYAANDADQSGNWTCISATVAAGTDNAASSHSGTYTAGAEYAIVHRDLAYNYSTPTYVTVPAAASKMIYLKNTMGWENAYVTRLGTSSYWDNTYGSGSNGRNGTHAMTYDSAKKLFYYEAPSDANDTYLCFTADNQQNYANFNGTQAVYVNGGYVFGKVVWVQTDNTFYKNTTKYYGNEDHTGIAHEGYSADVFLSGTFNEWAKTNDSKFSESAGTFTKTIELAANTAYQFQIIDNAWFGNNGGVVQSQTNWDFYASSGDCHMISGPAGNYTFTYSRATNKVSISYPTVEHPNAGYVYYDNSKTDWSTCQAHHFTGGSSMVSWSSCPAATAIDICGTEYFYSAFDKDSYSTIIFHNGSGTQTGDWALSGNGGKKREKDDADWSAFPTYTISFNGNGKTSGTMSSISSIAANHNQTITSNAFEKTGYTFAGWKADVAVKINGATVSAGTIIADGATLQNICGNIALTAQWTCVDPTITTDLSESQVDKYVGDASPTLTVAATAAGGSISYQWYSNTTKATAGATILTNCTTATYNPSTAAAGTTYYFCKITNSTAGCSNAVYSKIAKIVVSEAIYTVTYNVNGKGTVTPASVTQASSGASVTLATPSWSGYTIEAWYNNKTKLANAGASYTPTANITAYAHWTDNINGKVFSYIDNNYGDKFKGFDGTTWVSSDGSKKDKTYTNGTTGVQFVVDDGAWDSKSNSISSLAKFVNGTTSMSIVIPAGKIATVKISYGAYNTDNRLTVDGSNKTAVSTALTNGMTNAQVYDALKEITLNSQTGTLTLGSSTGNIYIGRVSAVITGYTVSYDKGSADGASGSLASGTKNAGSSFTLSSSSSAFTRTGYVYDGWSVNADGSTKDYELGGSYTTDAPITLYPHWEASCTPVSPPAPLGVDSKTHNSATLSWDGGSAGANGYKIALESATGAGTFDWTDKAEATCTAAGLTPSTTYTFKVKEIGNGGAGECEYSDELSVVFTTNAAPTYTVTYVYNGADGGLRPESATGSSVSLPNPTKTGCTLQGWYTSSGALAGSATATYDPTSNITLYALWRENCAGSGTKTLVDINFKDASWSGKTFSQANDNNEDYINGVYFWSKSSDKHFSLADNTSKGLTFPNSNMSSGNTYFCIPITGINSSDKQITVTLKHGYSSNKASYKYVYVDGRTTFVDGNTNGSGGEAVSDAANADTEITFTKNSLSNTSGHLIIGRNSSSYTQIYGVTVTTPNNATCYYVTYNGNGATGGFMTDETAHGSGDNVAILANTYTREGYTFTGWKTESSSGTSYEPEGTITGISSNITLYAQWSLGTLYSVTYNGNGATSGSVPVDLSSPYYSGTTEITVLGNTGSLALDNYTFDGWATANDGTGTSYAAGGEISVITSNIELFAKWKQTVTLNTGSQGSEEEKTPYIYINGAALNGFSAHSAAGYTLNGYYTAASGGTKVLEADGSFAAAAVTNYITGGKWSRTDATTLYAQWRAAAGSTCYEWDATETDASTGTNSYGGLYLTASNTTSHQLNNSSATAYTCFDVSKASKVLTGHLNGTEIASVKFAASTSDAGNNTFIIAFCSSYPFDTENIIQVGGYDCTVKDVNKYDAAKTEFTVDAPSGTKSFALGRNLGSGITSSATLENSGSRYLYYLYVCSAGGGTHTISYNAGGGTGTMSSDADIADDGTKTLKTNTFTAPTNYSFAGWVADGAVTIGGDVKTAGTLIADGATITNITMDIALTAKWTQSITLNANTSNHGTGDNTSATVMYNATALSSISHTSAESGYKLTGYFTADTDGTKVLNSDGTFAGDDITGWISDGKWTCTAGTRVLYAQYESSGSLIWNLGVNTAATSLTTSSKTSAFTEIAGSNMTNAVVTGLTYTGNAKSNLTGKISTPASEDAGQYVSVTFKVADGYKFTPNSVKVKVQPISADQYVKLELTDNAATPNSISYTTASKQSKGSTSTVEMTNGSGTYFTGTVTLKIFCYGTEYATDGYCLGTPISIDGEVEELCATMPTYENLNYDQNTYAVGESASALEIINGENINTYAWKQNTTNDRTGGETATEATNSASYTPPTTSAGTMYYWCEMTNRECGITIKSPAVAITVNASKSNATISWTGTSASANYGGGGYTVKATVNQTEWNGNAADLTLSAPAGIRIYNIESGTADSKKYVQASFDVTTAFDRETYSSTIPFTVSADATATYNAISNEEDVTFDACTGGGGSSEEYMPIDAAHIDNATWKGGWVYSGTGMMRYSHGGSDVSSGNVKSLAHNMGAGSVITKYYKSSANHFGFYTEKAINGVRLYVYTSNDKSTVSGVYIGNSAYASGTPSTGAVAYEATYYNDDDGLLETTNDGCTWVEITFDSEVAAGKYGQINLSKNVYIAGIAFISSSGSGAKLSPTLSFATTGPITKQQSSANFTNALTIGGYPETLGAITYTSSNTSCATVNATTGEVTITASGSAALNTTITATLAASGCYRGATASYVINVAGVTCEVNHGTLSSDVTSKCETENATLTLTDFESGATVQWYNGETSISNGSTYAITTEGTTSTMVTKAVGTYSVMVTKDACSDRSNSITISNKSTTLHVTRLVKEWYIKNGRLTPDIALWELGDDCSFVGVTASSGWDAGTGLTEAELGEKVFYEKDGIVYLKGTEPKANAGAVQNYTLTLTVNDGCGNQILSDEGKKITIHHQQNTDKHVLAFVVRGTEKGGWTDGVTADQTTNVGLYNAIAENFDVIATNSWSTDDEQKLKEYYSQFDILCITDYPDTKKDKGANKKSTVDALGALVDIRPILTMEAWVSGLTNWRAKGISGNPKSPTTRQYTMDLQCKDHEIFAGTDLTKVGEGDEAMYRVSMVDNTKEDYATLDATYGGGAHAEKEGYQYGKKPALQGFTFTQEMSDNDLLPIGLIDDGAGNPLQVGIERQHNMEARLMVLGINSYAMERLTDDGERVVINALNYLMKKNQEDIADCSTAFVGGAENDAKNWNNADNWTGNTVPLRTQKVRILADCEVSSTVYAQSVLIVTDGTYNKGSDVAAGKLTIKENGALIVSGKIQAASAPAYNRTRATTPDKLLIETSSTDQAALIFDNEEGETQATVNYHSKGYNDGSNYQFQYFAIPMDYVAINPIFANEANENKKIYTYAWDEPSNGWERRGYYSEFYAFEGLAITSTYNAPKNYTMTGNLASTAEREITLTHSGEGSRDNIIGNSWMAPINIASLVDAFAADESVEKTVYIYCAGNDSVDGDNGEDYGNTEVAGQWLSIPMELPRFSVWDGLKVIPAMQAYLIKVTGETTLTLNYDQMVRSTAPSDLNQKLRAPQRRTALNEDKTLTRLRVADSRTHTDLYLVEGGIFSDAFDNGWEATYMPNEGASPQFYAMGVKGKMAVLATNELDGTVVGFEPGKEAEYTITFSGAGNGYYLNDVKKQISTLITDGGTYSFTYEAGDDANRFYISATPFSMPQITTGMENLDAVAPKVQKVIYNDKMYIIRGGKVFSADGQLVK